MARTSARFQVRAPAAVLLGVCLLVACGKDTSQDPVSVQPRTVTGAVIKGPLQNATVKFFNIDAAGNATTLVSTVTTDAQGQFTTSLPAQSVPLLAVTFDGSYVDESDPETGPGRRRITLPASPTPGLEAVLPANATSIAITPYSNAMLLKARTQAGGGNFFNVFDAIQLQATVAFGFDPFTTIPQDPLAPNLSATLESVQYAMLLGGAANAINAIAVNAGHLPGFADVQSFISDMADGRLDQAGLFNETRRFRNNNFGLYGGFDVPAVDETLLSQPATVPNTPPTITAIADQVINEDTATSPASFTVGDAETPVGSLLLSSSSSDTAIVSNSGGIFLSGAGGGNFSVIVTPEPDAFGVVDISITVADADGGSAVETFQVTVNAINDAPVAVDDTSGTAEDIPLNIASATLTANDIDVDGPSLSVVAVSNPVNGSVNLAGGTVTFTPSGNYSGPASFEYTVSDGASPTPATDTGAVAITVNAANDAPVATDDAISLNEGGSASTLVGGASSVLANDTDIEGDTLTATVVSGPANALVFLLNPDGTFTYTHDGSETTTDSFIYEADDGNGGVAQATVTISITPVNDAPVAVDDAYNTDEDTPLTIAAPGVLSNDTDPDSSISVNGFSPTTANGAVTASGDGSFTYSPNPDFNGTDSFTYTAFDGTDTSAPATVTITINSVNDAPVAGSDSYTGTQGGTIATIAGIDDLLLNDTDVDNTPADLSVTPTPVTAPAHGVLTLNTNGSFSYVHDGSANLVDAFDYAICDLQPACATGTVSITLSPAAVIEPLLPYLAGDGNLELLDPTLALDASNPQNLDSGLPIADTFTHETFFTATLSGGSASDIRPARLVYIKNKSLKKVNLERGQVASAGPLSTITDACRINGSAEDIPNPDNSILRIDTAGADGNCNTADDNAAPAYLIRLGAGGSDNPFPIGVGQCCGNVGITNGSGALIEVLTTEGTGGSTFALNRRSATDFSLIATVATLQASGTGPTYSSHPRGLGDQHIYLRMRRDIDANFKLFRYNVADSSLTELYDYGVPDSTGLSGFLDESPYDASNLYFIDGAKILAVSHTATAPVSVPLVTAPAPVSRLDQTGTFLVYEAHDFGTNTGGVFSFPKAGGSPIPLAADDAAPTFAFLSSVDSERAYISMQSGSAVLSYTARVVNANDSAGTSRVDTADAQWAGEVSETTIDLQNDFDTGIKARAIFLRTDAATSTATLKIVDPVTGTLSGSTLGTVSEVMPGASVFGFGFGRYAMVTAFKATEHTDLYLGDTQTDNTGPLLFVEGIPGADDIWLLGDEDSGGGQQPLDSDGDGLTDAQEAALGTNPNNPDTDNDGLPDGAEVNTYGTNPLNPDTDGDGLPDGQEVGQTSTNPLNPDTDGDNVSDGIEFAVGSDPIGTINPVVYVDPTVTCGGGCDGTSWANAYPNEFNVEGANSISGSDPANTAFVLLASGTYGSLNLRSVDRAYVAYVGSVGPGIVNPAWPPTTTFSAGASTRALDVTQAVELILLNIRFENGFSSVGNLGGGVLITSPNHSTLLQNVVRMRRVEIANNVSDIAGGGVAVTGSENYLYLDNSTVSGNQANGNGAGLSQGGGLLATSDGRIAVTNSEIAGNSVGCTQASCVALGGGAAVSGGGTTYLSVTDSVVHNNQAFTGAGDGAVGGGLSSDSVGTLEVRSSTIRGNSANGSSVALGAGGGIAVLNSAGLLLQDSFVTGNTASAQVVSPPFGGGGGVYGESGSTMDLLRNVFADNKAASGPGGGVNLVDTLNVLIQDNRFLSNGSLNPGGGLHIHPQGLTSVFNNLFVGNASTDAAAEGGAVELHVESTAGQPLAFESNTVAYNQLTSATGGGGGLAVKSNVAATFDFNNNNIWFNQDSTLTDNGGDNYLQSLITVNGSGNNVKEDAVPGNFVTPLDPAFVQGFYLDPNLPSPSIDAGDDAFAGPLSSAPYTTDPAGTQDAVPIDIGFHHDTASAGPFGSAVLAPPRSISCSSQDTITFAPNFANAPSGEPGHLIVVELSGVSPDVTLSSLTTLDPHSNGSRIARDLGDGRYAVTTNGFFPGTAVGTFTVYADDQPPQTFQLTFTNGC